MILWLSSPEFTWIEIIYRKFTGSYRTEIIEKVLP